MSFQNPKLDTPLTSKIYEYVRKDEQKVFGKNEINPENNFQSSELEELLQDVHINGDDSKLQDRMVRSKNINIKGAKVSPFECHFHWWNKSSKMPEIDPAEVLRRLEIWISEREFYVSSGQHCTSISLILIKAVASFHCNKVKEAINEVESALTYIEKHQAEAGFQEQEHFKAYLYATYANGFHIYQECGKEGTKIMFNNAQALVLESPRALAAMASMKAIFLGHIGSQHREQKMLLFKKAVNLESFWEFWDYLSRSIRSLRRERNYMTVPGDAEIYACHKAFELNPNSCYTLHRIGLLYEEMLSAECEGTNRLMEVRGKTKIAKRMLEALRASLENNPSSVTVTVKLAEVLSSNCLRKLGRDIDEAERLFTQCMEKWPNNTEVLHKYGKFVLYIKKRPMEALEYFEKGLRIDQKNFPCTANYLRLLIRLDFLKHAMNYVNKVIRNSVFTLNPVYTGKILRLRGSLFWQMNYPEQAMKEFLWSFEEDPNSVHDNVLGELFGIVGGYGPVGLTNYLYFLQELYYQVKNRPEWISWKENFGPIIRKKIEYYNHSPEASRNNFTVGRFKVLENLSTSTNTTWSWRNTTKNNYWDEDKKKYTTEKKCPW